MKRLLIRLKWWIRGAPGSVMRRRIRKEMEAMGYEGAWTNTLISARKEQ